MAVKSDSLLLKRMLEIIDVIAGNYGATHSAENMLSNQNSASHFCVHAAYEHFRPKGEKKVWRSFITPKHAFILWLGTQLKLLIKDRLLYLNIDKNYVFCGTHLEMRQHLFFQWLFTSSIWMKIKAWMGIRNSMTTIQSALKCFNKEARETSQ